MGRIATSPEAGQRDSVPRTRLVPQAPTLALDLGLTETGRGTSLGPGTQASLPYPLRIPFNSVARRGARGLRWKSPSPPVGVRTLALDVPPKKVPGSAGPNGSELLLLRPHATNCLLGFVVLPWVSVHPSQKPLRIKAETVQEEAEKARGLLGVVV